MTIPQIRALAAHHLEQAGANETYAEMQIPLFGDNASATRFRLQAEFHSNTAVHLTELADGLTEALRLISILNLQP